MYDTIIVGAGIAGLTAAIYAARKRMKYEIISSDFGGQFMVSGEVLNYPGLPETTGTEFSQIMAEQARLNDVNVKTETVSSISDLEHGYKIDTGKASYDTRTVIIASGAKARKLGVPGEEEFAKKGVTYCSICDGPLFSGMDVAVIGGGDSALEAVDFLKDIASKIYVITNNNEFTAHEYLREKVAANPKVEVIYDALTKEIYGKDFVTGLRYEKDGREEAIDVRGVFIEIGRTPNTEAFKDFIELDEHGHISIDCQTRTSRPAIFAAGDCASGHEYQYVIAAGQGCMALIKAARYLAQEKTIK
ncbi:NAD(P)/FAD-dependent oxidoreductase [Candidatus Altiarchaeota archaeon]